MPAAKPKRLNWGQDYKNLPKLNLLEIQRESYQWFIEKGIKEALEEISPIDDFTGKNWQLSFGDYLFDKTRHTPSEAIKKGLTYDAPLRVEATLTNKKTGRKVTKEVFLGDIPQMTERATFIVNGIERGVINQIIRAPGAFFFGEIDRVSGRMLYQAEVRPLRGSWLEFNVNRNDVISCRLDRRRKFPITALLRAFGLVTDEEILETYKSEAKEGKDYILATLAKDPTKTKEEALIEIYQKMRPGEPAVLDNAREMFDNMFFDNRRYNLGKVGRYKINKRLGLKTPNNKKGWILRQDDVVETVRYLVKLQSGTGRVDDID
ncbi:DNA-directed RNA polymerase subunit beta, partial [Candidatus Saccharibacteria bacterium]|nr:DNA-directed RNA polymerase subunit beta [Candidatus Saccharibacteria bacterium]